MHEPQANNDPSRASNAVRRVLVTGAGGFIGSHLAEACVARGWHVTAFLHYNSKNQWGWLEGSQLAEQMEIISGDVRDYDSISRAAENCDTIFHLAALIGIPYSYISPLAYVRTNIEGTYNVLEAARALGTGRVLVTSTSETYGTAQYAPIDEKHPATAQSPYAATKIGADHLALSYRRSFDLPVCVVRPFNTYGPRQSARAFIPTVITQILQGERTLRLGNLAPTRDYTYVKDTVAAFLALAGLEKLEMGPVNIGTGTEISMRDLVGKIAGLLDVEVQIETEAARVRPDGSEVERLVCDNRRIRQLTGWHPAYRLEEGLRETIDWIREHQGAFKTDAYII